MYCGMLLECPELQMLPRIGVHFTFGAEGGIIGGAACEKGGGAREREV